MSCLLVLGHDGTVTAERGRDMMAVNIVSVAMQAQGSHGHMKKRLNMCQVCKWQT
jgi:hypothetical protein